MSTRNLNQLTPEENDLLVLRGMITSLPALDRQKVETCVAAMQEAIREAGPTIGNIAIALVGSEAQLPPDHQLLKKVPS